MRRRLWERKGAIAVETALTLPIILLLTLGGLSVLWWLHNKLWMQVLVSEVARERAADAMYSGYYKDIRDSVLGPGEQFELPDVRFLSFHIPTDPPLVMAAACNAPQGVVPQPPRLETSHLKPAPRPKEGDWIQPARDVREFLEEGLGAVESGMTTVDAWADQAVTTTERLIWYRRVAGNLAGKRAHQQRQALYYLLGGVLELGGQQYCARDANGGVVVTAKAVIQGEKTYAQR